MEADDIDSCKENIQPLRSGRKTRPLQVALQAQTDFDLQEKLRKERDEFELKIRMEEGDDPLQNRYEYVLWLEQSYLKHGRECNLVSLLEDTITIFKDDPRYVQDTRFVTLIIKFIETQVNPLELFQVVLNLGIGTMCAIFYKAWAEELTAFGDIKRADQIYQMGIQNHASPRDFLLQEHKQFQLFVGRQLLNGNLPCGSTDNSTDAGDQERARTVLGRISKKKVSSLRPTLGKAGTVPLCLVNRNAHTRNAPLQVYEEEQDNVILGKGERSEHFPKVEVSCKENNIKPGTWNKKYASRPHASCAPITPNFKVHEDPDAMSAVTPMHVSKVPNALKTRKADLFSCPMTIFEPPDPSVKPMYCKHLVYAGGREFQLEEIRAAIYNKRLQLKLSSDNLAAGFSSLHLEKGKTPKSSESVRPLPSQTGLTPYVHEMLKPNCDMGAFFNKHEKNEQPKCVNQLKFSCDSSGEDKQLQSLKDGALAESEKCENSFNLEYCNEEKLCTPTPCRNEDILVNEFIHQESGNTCNNYEEMKLEVEKPFDSNISLISKGSLSGNSSNKLSAIETPKSSIYTIYEDNEVEETSKVNDTHFNCNKNVDMLGSTADTEHCRDKKSLECRDKQVNKQPFTVCDNEPPSSITIDLLETLNRHSSDFNEHVFNNFNRTSGSGQILHDQVKLSRAHTPNKPYCSTSSSNQTSKHGKETCSKLSKVSKVHEPFSVYCDEKTESLNVRSHSQPKPCLPLLIEKPAKSSFSVYCDDGDMKSSKTKSCSKLAVAKHPKSDKPSFSVFCDE